MADSRVNQMDLDNLLTHPPTLMAHPDLSSRAPSATLVAESPSLPAAQLPQEESNTTSSSQSTANTSTTNPPGLQPNPAPFSNPPVPYLQFSDLIPRYPHPVRISSSDRRSNAAALRAADARARVRAYMAHRRSGGQPRPREPPPSLSNLADNPFRAYRSASGVLYGRAAEVEGVEFNGMRYRRATGEYDPRGEPTSTGPNPPSIFNFNPANDSPATTYRRADGEYHPRGPPSTAHIPSIPINPFDDFPPTTYRPASGGFRSVVCPFARPTLPSDPTNGSSSSGVDQQESIVANVDSPAVIEDTNSVITEESHPDESQPRDPSPSSSDSTAVNDPAPAPTPSNHSTSGSSPPLSSPMAGVQRQDEAEQQHQQRQDDARQHVVWMARATAQFPNSPLQQARFVRNRELLRDNQRAEAAGRLTAFESQYFQTQVGRPPNAGEIRQIRHEREVLDAVGMQMGGGEVDEGTTARVSAVGRGEIDAVEAWRAWVDRARRGVAEIEKRKMKKRNKFKWKRGIAIAEMEALFETMAGEREKKERERWEGRGGGAVERLKTRLQESFTVLGGEILVAQHTQTHTRQPHPTDSLIAYNQATTLAVSHAADSAAGTMCKGAFTFTPAERKEVERVVRAVAKVEAQEMQFLESNKTRYVTPPRVMMRRVERAAAAVAASPEAAPVSGGEGHAHNVRLITGHGPRIDQFLEEQRRSKEARQDRKGRKTMRDRVCRGVNAFLEGVASAGIANGVGGLKRWTDDHWMLEEAARAEVLMGEVVDVMRDDILAAMEGVEQENEEDEEDEEESHPELGSMVAQYEDERNLTDHYAILPLDGGRLVRREELVVPIGVEQRAEALLTEEDLPMAAS